MDRKVTLEHPDEPYKATIEWAGEGIKVTVEAQALNLPDLATDEIKAECNRRAKLITDHIRFLIGREAKLTKVNLDGRYNG